MHVDRSTRLRRLSSRLPLSIAALLTLAVGGVSWMAYRGVRAIALSTATDRLERSAGQLASLISAGVSTGEMLELAADPALAAALQDGGPGAVAAAEDVLGAALSGSPARRVALWSVSGAMVIAAHREATPDAPAPPEPARPDFATPDTVAISGFRLSEGAVWFRGAAPVRGTGSVLGYVVVSSTVQSEPRTVRTLSDLIAPGARFIVGQPGGVWTDLIGPAEPPPDAALASPRGLTYGSSTGEQVLGYGMPLPATPWLLWIEVPTAPLLVLARDFLSRILPMGLLAVLAGAAVGAALSHRINARLGGLRAAATAIASGDYRRRAPTGSYVELDELAAAFNFMAEQVADSQGRLEEQIAMRTAALEAREAEFRTLATTAPDAIVTADQEGRITYFNPGAERIFGYDAAKVVGELLTILMPERFQEAHRRGFARHVETGGGTFGDEPRELFGRRRDGSEFPLELALAGRRHDGRMLFTGIIRDITERKRREQAVGRYASELEAANKELEAFSYSVSHDLRAPLRAIHGFSQALAEDYEERLDEKGIGLLGRVRRAAERMGLLIDDLLGLSRATRAEMRREPVDLTEMSLRIASDLGAAEPERCVDLDVEKGLEARADSHLIKLVMGNLLGNAWKFTAKKERAVVQVGRSAETDEFFVRDNGAGFDMAYVDKLFNPFQRLHPESDFQGTGVGLALVQRIVHRHGGKVRAEGEVEGGATFYFTLPADKRPG